ncbi:MAG: tetratricopeptide repeat protein [Gammaproteobacteria bacterium]|nr:tetratricopeptide repeat protein [Gammaproteobacteria bacterium]
MSTSRPYISGRMLRRSALLGAAVCALLLAGCAEGPGETVEVAGRQAPGSVPPGATEAAVLRVAAQMRDAGDLGAAVAFYRRAHEMRPSDAKPLVELGDTLNQAGAPNEAVSAYQKALELYPNHPEALRGLGITLVALNQPAAAVGALQQSLKAAPDPRAYGGIGVAEDLLGNYKAAEDAYHQGLTLAPADLSLRNNLGLSQAIAGEYEEAVETLRAVASDSAAGARHRLNLALALGLAGHTEEAARVARIDLDEGAVRSNLAYYAQLRALSPSARAQAVFRPNVALNIATDPPARAASCTTPPCDTAASANESASSDSSKPAATAKMAAKAAAPVDAEPLTPPVATEGQTGTPAAVPTTAAPVELSGAAPPSQNGGQTGASSEPAPGADPGSADAATPGAAGTPAVETTVAPAAQTSAPSPADAATPVAGTSPAAADATASATPVDGKEKDGQWVQLAAMVNEKRAKRAWHDVEQRGGDVLHDVGHQVQRVDLGPEKGVVFRLRVGPIDTVENARSLCSELKGRGIDCFLVHS